MIALVWQYLCYLVKRMQSHRVNNPPGTNTLTPRLGLATTIAIVVGGMIGSGIFRNPAAMGEVLQSPLLLIGVWVVAGVVTLFGALTNAEIAGMIPATGGQYQYFRVIYGEFIAFLYGWALFIVIQTGSIASITFVFSESFNALFPLPTLSPDVVQAWKFTLPFATIYPLENLGVKILTAVAVCALTLINMLGVREGGRVQVVFTVSKVLAIIVLIVASFAFGNGSIEHLISDPVATVPMGSALMLAIVVAMNKALWSYDGWNNITYVAGEVVQPQRTIPKALIIGTISTIAVYVLINLAYLYLIPISSMQGLEGVAVEAARIAMGPMGVTFVAVAVMISTLGTSNGTILASSRVYYSMARERMFFTSIGTVHGRTHTPVRSLAAQMGWTVLLVFTGTFDMLTDMLIFVSWGFYALGAAGVFVLRKRQPDTPRPYRAWGYPVVPAVFIAFALGFLGFTVVSDIERFADGSAPVVNSLWGMLLLITGVPFYWLFRRRSTTA